MRCAKTNKILSILTRGTILNSNDVLLSDVYAEELEKLGYSEMVELHIDLIVQYALKKEKLSEVVNFFISDGRLNRISDGVSRSNAKVEITDLLNKFKSIPIEVVDMYSASYLISHITFYSRGTISSVLKSIEPRGS